MFIGLSVISILTGTISAQLSSAAIRGNIQSIYDLKPSNIICTPLPLYKTDYLVQYNVGNYVAPTHTLQECFDDIKRGKADAVFYDATALRYGVSRDLELRAKFKVLPTEHTIVLGSVFPKTQAALPNKLRFDEICLNFKERESAKFNAFYQRYFPSNDFNEQDPITYNWPAIGFAVAFLILYTLASMYDAYRHGDLDFIFPARFTKGTPSGDEKKSKEMDVDWKENKLARQDHQSDGKGIEMIGVEVMDNLPKDQHFCNKKAEQLSPGSDDMSNVHHMLHCQQNNLEQILSILQKKNGNEGEIEKKNLWVTTGKEHEQQ